MITGIVVALPEELTTLTANKIKKGGCAFIADKLLVAYSGAGAANAQAAAELLITKGATRLISWGCAAALSATLKPGDLILADKLIDAGGGGKDKNSCVPTFCVSSDWHSYAKNLLAAFIAVHTGCLAESKSIVSSGKDKKQLHALTGAVALDMESIAIARVARQYALPFLVIRTIADPANMDLPLTINYSLNNQGDIVLSKLLMFLVLHPTELPGLIKLGLHFNAARNALKSIARHLDTITDFNADKKIVTIYHNEDQAKDEKIQYSHSRS